MSKFLRAKFQSLEPYDTSEELESMNGYIRLNTNESPFTPSPKSIEYAHEAAKGLNYYCDPECKLLAEKIAVMLNVKPSEIVFGNGSDEILNFLFMGFCEKGAAFPEVTYSFYKILAKFHGVNYITLPLNKNLWIDVADYAGMDGRTIFIANPNAPTGLATLLMGIESIVLQNPNSLVVVDEAYIDFGGKSAVDLIHRYKNLVVTRTFSKSRSLAGGRLGYCIANEELAKDIRDIKNTITPYNINAMTQAAGLGSLEDSDYYEKNIKSICDVRESTKLNLRKLGFDVTDSMTNFLFTRHERFSGQEIFNFLKQNGIMIRYFSSLPEYNRITIGTHEQMQKLLNLLGGLINA
ncbi:MAG: histidinol-phosphate transaminase [Synergistaceae bacterium]|nr:histidinol-phosphate transaminase [Synergistaceae bacterium]